MIKLTENRYGKSRIRLMKVTRHPHGNDLYASGPSKFCSKATSNPLIWKVTTSRILPTGHHEEHGLFHRAKLIRNVDGSSYAKELAEFFLSNNPQVHVASIQIESTLWKRLTIDGKPHPDTFMRGSGELQTTHVERAQKGIFTIHSGLDHLVLLKTANSGFEGYIKDSLTTLKETSDRLLGTAVQAVWRYTSTDLDYNATRYTIREAMLKTFAEPRQQIRRSKPSTPWPSALEAISQIDEVEITMPNKHCLLSRPLPLRPGQSQRNLRPHRRAPRLHPKPASAANPKHAHPSSHNAPGTSSPSAVVSRPALRSLERSPEPSFLHPCIRSTRSFANRCNPLACPLRSTPSATFAASIPAPPPTRPVFSSPRTSTPSPTPADSTASSA